MQLTALRPSIGEDVVDFYSLAESKQRHSLGDPLWLKTFSNLLLAFNPIGGRHVSGPALQLLSAQPRALVVASDVPPKRVVFLGTPDVAARSLELLLEASRNGRGGGFEVSAVVTQPPAPKGKKNIITPSPVQVLAEAEGLKLFTPPNAKDEAFLTALEELKPDLCITAAYGCFLPQRFIDVPAKGTLNIHPSLLPLYRGAAPVQRSLEAGDEITGVTVLFTVLKMDAGPILRQVNRELDGTERADELLLELFETGTEQLVDSMPSLWDASYETALVQQDDARATKAPKLNSKEAEVRFDVQSAAEVHNRGRGFAAGPGIWTEFDLGNGKPPVRTKLTRTSLPEMPAMGDGGGSRVLSLNSARNALEITCADGSVLEVLELVPAGKKPTTAKAFWNGLRGRETRWVGSRGGKDQNAAAPALATAAPPAAKAPPSPREVFAEKSPMFKDDPKAWTVEELAEKLGMDPIDEAASLERMISMNLASGVVATMEEMANRPGGFDIEQPKGPQGPSIFKVQSKAKRLSLADLIQYARLTGGEGYVVLKD